MFVSFRVINHFKSFEMKFISVKTQPNAFGDRLYTSSLIEKSTFNLRLSLV